jgi:orotidine-5'-phosphate decarboxylase
MGASAVTAARGRTPDRAPFIELLATRWQAADSLLCVGLDPDPARFAPQLRGREQAITEFCCAIVDATAAYACAFKPQIAYFASHAAEAQLEAVLEHIRSRHPQIPVILDAKRGDIGSTAEHYAREAFERYGADAVTLSPYMGQDTITPFLDYPGRAAFLLCRTSNPGGDDLQMLDVGGERLFERVARLAATQWHRPGQLGLVVGATYPQELARVRALAPALPLLVPGIGAQGGDIAATLQAGRNAGGDGLVINSSRAILYAGSDGDYAAAAARVARETRDQINRHRGG